MVCSKVSSVGEICLTNLPKYIKHRAVTNGNTLKNDFVTQPLPPPTRLAALLLLLLLLDDQCVAAVRVAGLEPLAHQWRVVGLLVVFASGWIAGLEPTVRSHMPASSYKF